jgi:hypothetical protein
MSYLSRCTNSGDSNVLIAMHLTRPMSSGVMGTRWSPRGVDLQTSKFPFSLIFREKGILSASFRQPTPIWNTIRLSFMRIEDSHSPLAHRRNDISRVTGKNCQSGNGPPQTKNPPVLERVALARSVCRNLCPNRWLWPHLDRFRG